MPKIVDHARRREEIAALTVSVIQREGSGAATVRRIAKEGGFSIGVLGHYFRDKDEMIAFAFRWMADQTFRDLDAAVAGAAPGLARLRAALQFMVPGAGSPTFMAVWVSLWDGALRNPALAHVHGDYYARWRQHLRRHLGTAVRLGEVESPGSLADAVDLLSAGIDGLWIAATFESTRLGPRRRRALVERMLGSIVAVR